MIRDSAKSHKELRTDCGVWRRGMRQEKEDRIFRGLFQVILAERGMGGKVTLEGAAGSRVVGKDGNGACSGNEERSLQEEKGLTLCCPVRGQPLPTCGYSVLVIWPR